MEAEKSILDFTRVEIKLKLTVKGDEIIADYTGTSPQKGGALHPNYWFTASLTYAGLRAVLPR